MTDLDRIIADLRSMREREAETADKWPNVGAPENRAAARRDALDHAIAALAGAEPVATFEVKGCGPCAPDFDMEWHADYRTFANKGPIKLFTHAPAKAREDVIYAAGWRQCARWASRDDLIADIGSPAYDADKAAALATFAEGAD